jgi:hypothetical protein
MANQGDLVTVYRSMETSAKEDCETIAELLESAGLTPVLLDDDAPGVPEGAYEVRVPAAQAKRGDELVKSNPLPDEMEDVDPSEELDLETIYQSGGAAGEVEAMGIKNVLEANGIAAVIVGDSVLPNLGFEVRVAHELVERAKELLKEAQSAGPAAAEAAELASESGAGEKGL